MILKSEDNILNSVNIRLKEVLSPPDASYAETVYESMRYSVLAGGKRLRPLLLMAAYQAQSAKVDNEDTRGFERAVDFACAIEMIHCYSLIHDDLPAMDNDDFRRGKPTNHKVYGEAIAILAGDSLLNKAFELMAAHAEQKAAARAMLRIAQYSGADGMIGGQAADILQEGKEPDKECLAYIHTNKTGALFRGAMVAGATLANADDCVLSKLDNIALKLGLAFQIKDDILDLTSTDAELGKPVGSDSRNEKLTYPALFGLEKSQADYEKFSSDALTGVQELFGIQTNPVADLIKRLTDRIN